MVPILILIFPYIYASTVRLGYMHVSDVFTHNSYPEHTYVERERRDLESSLEDALRVPGGIVSLSGPSKSGKPMLVRRVARRSHIKQMAEIKGSNINSVGDLWRESLNNLSTPSTTEYHSTDVQKSGRTIKGGGNVGVSGGVSAGVSAGADQTSTSSDSETNVRIDDRRGLNKLIESVERDKFVLLIDDFHYIDTDIQSDIAEAIKGAAEKRISVCVALVGYRSENLEKVNDDLSGRVRSISLSYWHEQELREIASLGFSILNVEFPDTLIDTLVREAAGSPQLMQLLCYSTCLQSGIREPQDEKCNIDIDEGDRNEIFKEAIEWGGYSDVVQSLNEGATTRGEGRNTYDLSDGGKGDYYECCLRAIAANPPEFSFERDELYDRVKMQCRNDHPQSNQVSLFCEQMEKLTNEERPSSSLVKWDEEEETLHISEPGLLFNIRWYIRLNYD